MRLTFHGNIEHYVVRFREVLQHLEPEWSSLVVQNWASFSVPRDVVKGVEKEHCIS